MGTGKKRELTLKVKRRPEAPYALGKKRTEDSRPPEEEGWKG